MGQKIALSNAFDENAIRSIAHAAHMRGSLTSRLIRHQAPVLATARTLSRFVPSSRVLKDYVQKQSDRLRQGALPEDRRLAPVAEFVRILGSRVRLPGIYDLGNAGSKVLFDAKASTIDLGEAEVLISMPGASLQTFTNNRDRKLVFHEVDAHPRVRNQKLEMHYGRRFAKAEMYPEWFVQRIEHELELADAILVPGRVVADQMAANNVPPEKILKVPYGVNPSVFTPPETPVVFSGNRPLRAIYTGQISLRKGVPFLLEAVRGLPVELTLVGQIFDRRILKNLPQNVKLAGVLNAQELAELYARSDVFVLPAIEDCFALVVAEAAAAGLPVITTFDNGSHELLSPRHTVIPSGSPSEIREALKNHSPLGWEERLHISQEALSSGWTDWQVYGTTVLEKIGSLKP